jgi:hypothetical protein
MGEVGERAIATEAAHAARHLLSRPRHAGLNVLLPQVEGACETRIHRCGAVPGHRPVADLRVPRRGDLADHRQVERQLQPPRDDCAHGHAPRGHGQNDVGARAPLGEQRRELVSRVASVAEDVEPVAQLGAIEEPPPHGGNGTPGTRATATGER